MKFTEIISIAVFLLLMSCNRQTTQKTESPGPNSQKEPTHPTGTWLRKDYVQALNKELLMYKANKQYGNNVELQIKSGNSADTLTAELSDIYGMMPHILNVYHRNGATQGVYYFSFLGTEPPRQGYAQVRNNEIILSEGKKKIIYMKILDSTSVFRDGLAGITYQILAGTYQVQNENQPLFKVTLKPNGEVIGFKNYTHYQWYASDNADLDMLLFSKGNEMEYYAVDVTKGQIKLYYLQEGFPGESIITAVPQKKGLAYTFRR